MLLLLLACVGGDASNLDPFLGQATLTVRGGAAVEEAVQMDLVGVSQVEGDPATVFTAADQDGVFELDIVLDGFTGAGAYTPRRVRYRKGQQALLDAAARCEVEVEEGADVAQPWILSFSCEDMQDEEGQARGDAPGWSLVDGRVAGGATTALTSRSERLAASGFTLDLALRAGPAGETYDQTDPDRALVVPWRGDETRVLFEDGGDDSLDDLVLRVVPATGRVDLRRFVRGATDAGSALSLRIASTDGPLNAVIDGATDERSGQEIELEVWPSVQEGPDELVVLIW